nr:hypothetical protein [Bacillus sp. REN3]
MSSRVENEENRISSLRGQVDGRIASRRNIGRNLSEAAAKARTIEKKLGKLHQFIDASMDLYMKADKKADRFREPEKKSIWEKFADGFKTANDIRKGFRKGVAEALFSTVEGIWNAVTHPVKTAKGIVYAIGYPLETAKSIWNSISDSWKNDVINGDAKSRSEWFGRAVGEAALAIIGTKGVDKAVKVAKGARVVKEGGGVRVVRPETIEKKDGGDRDGKRVAPERKYSGDRVEKREIPRIIDGNGGIGDNGRNDTGNGIDNGNKETSQPRTAEQIISDRTKGLDLNPHPIQQKQLSAKKMKDLRVKIENRTITKAEYEQYIWNKKFVKHRASGVTDFWYQERQRILNNETPTRDWNQEQLNDILNGKKPKVDGEIVQGHHSYSASQYPHLANKGEIIYPATPNEHFKGWHGGNWKNSLPGKPINPIDDF